MKDARHLAVSALVKVNSSGGYSNLVMDAMLDNAGLQKRDGAFATALFYGVLERMITLDYCIARYSKIPIPKMDKQVREILRISFYQILFMDSVPHSAAVSEGVALAKKVGKTSAGGFINGVLRAFLRDGVQIFPQGKETQKLSVAQRYCIEYSAPSWLWDMLAQQYDEQTAQAVLAASVGRAPLFVRVNTLKTNTENLVQKLLEANIGAKPCDGIQNAVELADAGDITKLAAFAEGLFHVQDIASQICCDHLCTTQGQRVLDVCSAPGGKAFTLAEHMQNKGEVVACDLYEQRVALIAKGTARLGISCIKTMVNNAEVYNPILGEFDRILCDVPCSGLGIIRRKPEIKYKEPQDFKDLPDLQYKILQTSSQYLAVGGLLVYSTCTFNKAENEEVVHKFLAENPQFEQVEEPVTMLTHQTGSDGFFVAVIRRLV